jgi:hypothetical protein
MGSNGLGPKPFTAHQARTLFVRVAPLDWPLVKRGHKREFRGMPGKQSALWMVEPPQPVVAYIVTHANRIRERTYDARLMLLEKAWQEELGAISDESLQAEGYESFAEFRRAWMRRQRNGQKFKPTTKVFAYRVRPWEPGDEEKMGAAILKRLYGEWL